MNALRTFLTFAILSCLAAGVAAQDRQPDKKGNAEAGAKAAGKSGDIVARVAKDMQSAEDRLKKTDPGDVTRKIQRDIVDGLAELIKQSSKSGGGGTQKKQSSQKQGAAGKSNAAASKDASPNDKGGPKDKRPGPQQAEKGEPEQRGQAKGGDGDGPQSKDKDKGNNEAKDAKEGIGKAGGKDNKDNKDDQKGQAKGNEPGKGGQQNGMGVVKTDPPPKTKTNYAADTNRTDWGHLPLSKRLEMDAYSKERFMPRYDEVLQQYYRTIADQGRKKE